MSLPYAFRIVGPTTGSRRLVGAGPVWAAYCSCDERAEVQREAYLSAFEFGDDFRTYLDAAGSPKGFAGVVGASFIWFDIDREDNLQLALDDTRRLICCLSDRYQIDEDLLTFYSGAKGFHVGLPTSAWNPQPSLMFNRIARAMAEAIAAQPPIAIDSGVYDKVRPFRAPNSRHPKTGLHKRRLSFDETMHLSIEAIRQRAGQPEAFEYEPPAALNGSLLGAWSDAADAVTKAQPAQRQPGETAHLNRLTLDFIRNGAAKGDRHRLLYSAAANLGEFEDVNALAHAILTEPALDTGLSPSEAKRQIECGLADAKKVRPA